MTKEEYENLCLAIAAGSEETDSTGALRPREQRLANALYRINDMAAGNQQSINEKASATSGQPAGATVTGTFEGVIK